ncbi:MAG TPA: 2-dehydropantoate 2-reductase N-terminal domain-containing protein [Candidatus Acidoferrales bacterium]|nr:2-dehydropantoate 2-reductase N-terminal domain-containing protein [Candidatus Acidoferrales bacterium]
MKILVFGAGAVGSFNAARLKDGGHDVSLLARGHRLLDLQEHGVVLESARSGERTTTQVPLVGTLEPDDAYDLVLVTMRRHQVPAILPALAQNRHTPTVLFMGNNAGGADDYVAALGAERVLLGQGNIGGVRVGHVVRFIWARVLPLEFGELDGRRTPRCDAIAAAYRQAGLTAHQVRNIDASLKTHAASLLPVVGALYWAKGDVRRLAHSRKALRLWVLASREAQRALRRVGVRIVPAVNRVLYEWVPERLLVFGMARFLDTEFAAAGLADADVEGAPGEMKELVEEFRAILRRAGEPAPACERLYAFVDARWAEAQAEPSAGAGFVTLSVASAGSGTAE